MTNGVEQEKWHEVGNNQLKLVVSASARMRALVDLINGAEVSLHIFFYMFEEDQTGQTVMDLLIKACHRGVSVELMVDSFGSNGASDSFFRQLETAGAKLAIFNPRISTSYFVRNHQKMAIADKKLLIIGGFNIADQYFNLHSEDKNQNEIATGWEDLGLLLKGPEVDQLMRYYRQLSGWVYQRNGRLRALRKMIKSWQPGDGQFRWLLGGPSNRLSQWAVSIKRDLEQGQRLDLVTAYFSPGQGLLRRIGKLSKRGGISRMIFAGKTDNAATIGASRLLYGYLLKRKAKVFEYQPKRLHMKLVVVDDAVYIGSANFDIRSLFINVEMMLRIEDKKFAEHARKLIDGLSKRSEEITLPLHNSRAGLLNRLRWTLSYLVVNAIDYSVTRRFNFGLGKKADLLPPGD
ncbi:MAG: phosphatidylserine/phosphatidylglycerophosphate/cardiolipin synthase family protein [Parasphingorhabdus sp.]